MIAQVHDIGHLSPPSLVGKYYCCDRNGNKSHLGDIGSASLTYHTPAHTKNTDGCRSRRNATPQPAATRRTSNSPIRPSGLLVSIRSGGAEPNRKTALRWAGPCSTSLVVCWALPATTRPGWIAAKKLPRLDSSHGRLPVSRSPETAGSSEQSGGPLLSVSSS